MQITSTYPTQGSFVMVWEYDSNIFCEAYRWEAGDLMRFDVAEDEWVYASTDELRLQGIEGISHIKFITTEG